MPILETWADWQAVTNDESWHFTVRASMDAYGFTGRHRDVAWGVLRGMSNKEIAAEAGITESTVKNHMSEIFKRTGTQDRLQLVLRLLGVTRDIHEH